MKPLTLDSWKSAFDLLSIFAAAVTLVSLLGSYIAGSEISKRDAEQKRLSEQTISELQERSRGRTIDPDARAILLEELRNSPPDGLVDISFITEAETRAFMLEIVDVLKEAGWPVSPPDGGPAAGGMVIGLSILVPPSEAIPARSIVLQRALERAGFPTRIRQAGKVRPGAVRLQVGTKP